MALGDKRQLFRQAYYKDPQIYSNRGWTQSGALDGPGIVQQYFLSTAVIPAFLTGGVYNPISGSDWSAHWLWPRSKNLAEWHIHRSVRKLFPRDDTDWASDDDDTLDACMGMEDDERELGGVGEDGDEGDNGASPALASNAPVKETKKRSRRGIKGRPKGSGNKKGKKGSSIGQVVTAAAAPQDGGMEVVTPVQLTQPLDDDDPAQSDLMDVDQLEQPEEPDGANNSDAMNIDHATPEGWLAITVQNAHEHSELLSLI